MRKRLTIKILFFHQVEITNREVQNKNVDKRKIMANGAKASITDLQFVKQ